MTHVVRWALWCAAFTAPFAHAQELAQTDFLWRGMLEVPAGASLVRVPVPAEALTRMQTPGAHDLRVFNAQSRRVPRLQRAQPAG